MTPTRRHSPSNNARQRSTPTIYLVRHGKAENRERWTEPDSERPLTKRGIEQSRIIASHLADLAGRSPSRVLSSPAVRCSQTVEPLAKASKLEVVHVEWLNEGSAPDYAFDQLRKLVVRLDPPSGVGGPVVACTHGDVIWGILERLHRLGVDLGLHPDAPKGGVWIIGLTAARIAGASFYQPDEGRKGAGMSEDGDVAGVLALVGGAEWQPGCDFDAELLERSGGSDVVILPTAAAYEHPERAVAAAAAWFASLGGRASGLMVLSHADACLEENAAVVRGAGFVYLSGGSPLHLRSVLKGSAVFEALGEAWRGGAVVAGSSAGAMVLCDPMVDPRGGAYTVGLGLVEQMAVIPHHDSGGEGTLWRTLAPAPAGVPVVGIPERTALVREPGGKWRQAGEGKVTVFLDGASASIESLPG